MKAMDFKSGRHYSRDRYKDGQTVTRPKVGVYEYHRHGGFQSRVSDNSSVNHLDDFYLSNRAGERLQPFCKEGEHIEYKDKDMGRFENGSTIIASAKDETVDVAQITIGKVIYTTSVGMLGNIKVIQLKWYEKLFTSAKKRELAQLVATYVAIKLIQTKYDHYLLQSVSAYINFQLQTELLGGMTQGTLDKLFSKFEKVSS